MCGGGAWPEPLICGSLAAEGRAMLCAVVDDLSMIADIKVETTWDARLGPPPFRCVRAQLAESHDDEQLLFQRLAYDCDATLLIAPEFDGILTQRCRAVEDRGGRLLSPGSRAVEPCSDKLRLARHLREAGVRTIPTETISPENESPSAAVVAASPFPIVIKPRDGAGSQNTFLIKDSEGLEQWRNAFAAAPRISEFIWQPYIAGTSVSVAMIFSESGSEVRILRVAEQLLSDDGRFSYRGGRVPACDVDRTSIQAAALAACRSVPGLRGYVGVDLIVPADGQSAPIVVEINPRLTTSYLGYRALARDNLAEWMLPGRTNRPIEWRTGEVEFNAAGNMAE